jgi:hypothetical protein
MLKAEGKARPGPLSGITYIEDTGKVLYRRPMTHGTNKKNPLLSLSKELVFKQK